MTVMLWVLMLLVLLAYLVRIPLIWDVTRTAHYDNRHPRAQQQQLTGLAARANAAHYNSLEALLLYLCALLASSLTARFDEMQQWLALGYGVARLLYVGCYLANWSTLRSMVWTVGFGCIVALIGRSL